MISMKENKNWYGQ